MQEEEEAVAVAAASSSAAASLAPFLMSLLPGCGLFKSAWASPVAAPRPDLHVVLLDNGSLRAVSHNLPLLPAA